MIQAWRWRTLFCRRCRTVLLRRHERGTLIHGTTLVTNALIERKGAPTALLATSGFRDAVEIGREHRYELYDLNLDLPKPLVPRHLRFDVPERIAADGSVLQPLDEDFRPPSGLRVAR